MKYKEQYTDLLDRIKEQLTLMVNFYNESDKEVKNEVKNKCIEVTLYEFKTYLDCLKYGKNIYKPLKILDLISNYFPCKELIEEYESFLSKVNTDIFLTRNLFKDMIILEKRHTLNLICKVIDKPKQTIKRHLLLEVTKLPNKIKYLDMYYNLINHIDESFCKQRRETDKYLEEMKNAK